MSQPEAASTGEESTTDEHSCPHCPESFDRESVYYGHLAHHPEACTTADERTEPCPVEGCDAMFATQHQVRSHQAAHAPPGGFPDREPLETEFETRAARYAPLHGFIPRVEAIQAHRAFLWAVRPAVAMLSIVEARKLVKRGATAASWAPPETSLITTTTVSDRKLANLPVHVEAAESSTTWTEAAIIRAFRPVYHFPADYPTYGDDPPATRATNAERCAAGTVYMAEHAPPETTIIPLIKGTTAEERAPCRQAVQTVGTPLAGVYVQQHYGVGGGGGEGAARDLVRCIINETDGAVPLLLIGAGSARTVAKYPEAVVATAGQHAWRTAVTPRSSEPLAMRRSYANVDDTVADALSVPPQYTQARTPPLVKATAPPDNGAPYAEPATPADTAEWHVRGDD